MGIKETIQLQINVYDGAENRVIKRTMEQHFCSKKCVQNNINWLLRKGFIKIVEYNEMNDGEKRYFQSDSCRILRNLSFYNETEYLNNEAQRKQEEDKLPIVDKFRLYFSKMEEELKWNYPFTSQKCYSLIYGKNNVTITLLDEKRSISICFESIQKLYYDEQSYRLCFMLDGETKWNIIELCYMNNKCFLKHYYD